jgi:hypothetical protein
MNSSSLLKGLIVGDLVYYKLKNRSETCIDKTRVGIIVELAKKTAMGFHMVCVMWNDTQEVDCIAENYLHKINAT